MTEPYRPPKELEKPLPRATEPVEKYKATLNIMRLLFLMFSLIGVYELIEIKYKHNFDSLLSVFVLCWLVTGIYALRGNFLSRREKYLLEYGTPAAGKITGSSLSRYGVFFTYAFHDNVGEIRTGTRNAVPFKAAKLLNTPLQELKRGDFENPDLAEGFEVIKENTTVLYDPKNSRINLLYPPARVRLLRQ